MVFPITPHSTTIESPLAHLTPNILPEYSTLMEVFSDTKFSDTKASRHSDALFVGLCYRAPALCYTAFCPSLSTLRSGDQGTCGRGRGLLPVQVTFICQLLFCIEEAEDSSPLNNFHKIGPAHTIWSVSKQATNERLLSVQRQVTINTTLWYMD